MGLFEFLIFVLLVVGTTWFITWVMDYFFDSHPPIFNKIMWGVAIIIVLIKLFAVLGLTHYDPQIPHIN